MILRSVLSFLINKSRIHGCYWMVSNIPRYLLHKIFYFQADAWNSYVNYAIRCCAFSRVCLSRNNEFGGTEGLEAINRLWNIRTRSYSFHSERLDCSSSFEQHRFIYFQRRSRCCVQFATLFWSRTCFRKRGTNSPGESNFEVAARISKICNVKSIDRKIYRIVAIKWESAFVKIECYSLLV